MEKQIQTLADCRVKQLQSLRITFKLSSWFRESFQRWLGKCRYVSFVYPGPIFRAEKLDPNLILSFESEKFRSIPFSIIMDLLTLTDGHAGTENHLPVKVSVLLLILGDLEDCLDGLDHPWPEWVRMSCDLGPDYCPNLVRPHALILNLLIKPDLRGSKWWLPGLL